MSTKALKVFSLAIILILALGVVSACSSKTTTGSSTSKSAESSNPTTTTTKQESTATNQESSKVKYPTKEIKLIVPYSAGGGFDTSARMLAPYLGKYLPNDVSVIIENLPGGEGNIGLGEVARSKPDGHTLALINLPGHFVKQILKEATYDLQKLEYVGNITTTTYLAAASLKSGYISIQDFQNAEKINAGITNVSSTDGLGLVVSADSIGIKINTINHKGSSEAILSAIRGDVDIVQFPVESLMSHIESGDLTPLWVYSNERIPELPDVPTILELGYGELLETVSLHRALATTPGTPKEVLDILREAFDKATSDPEYKKQVEESGATYNPGNYEVAKQTADSALDKLLPFVDLIKEARN
jgi:tripartite-type tricarboxylate transporter receptor subunit TctC